MPRQGGQGKGKPKLVDKNFGRALIKRQLNGDRGSNGIRSKNKVNMMSIIDNSALEDYIITTEMGGDEVEVIRTHDSDAVLIEPTINKNIQEMSVKDFDYQHLSIPRRPKWNTSMTAEEVDHQEKQAFLQWRRYIAALESSGQASKKVTPFEKNLDVWRQLWRVTERSDMIFQVVDARNPLLYFTNDLKTYVGEHAQFKPMILLINKADFLTEHQRIEWGSQLKKMGLNYIFYSAKIEQTKLDKNEKATELTGDQLDDLRDYCELFMSDFSGHNPRQGNLQQSNMSDFVWGDNTWNKAAAHMTTENPSSQKGAADTALGNTVSAEISGLSDSSRTLYGVCPQNVRILNRLELMHVALQIHKLLGLSVSEKNKGKICVGMVGYPNVGKSSVINTLLGVSKSTHDVVRVGVSSTPGKTKHFQTLILSSTLMLCDCPGLVFPSFMSSTGEMLCSGILPINQMRDIVEPATVISTRVPQHLLEAAYGMNIVRDIDVKDNPNRPPTAYEMLAAYCAIKGYITNGTGRWDEFRACKEMLRDFNDGKILYVATPNDSVDMRKWLAETEKTMMKIEKTAERLVVKKLAETCLDDDESSTAKPVNSYMPELAPQGTLTSGVANEEEFEIISSSDSEDEGDEVQSENMDSVDAAAGATKREHKRLKHWGKKNKKLRDKNPYGDHNGAVSYVAYSTNRQYGAVAGATAHSLAHDKVKRHDPRNTYGSAFVRAVLPHHDPATGS